MKRDLSGGRSSDDSQDAAGDGTVPWQSGEAPGKAIPKGRTFAIDGYDHQKCYDHERVRQFSLWALTRLVQEAP